MHCKDIQDLITAEVDGELAAEPRRNLQDHLSECTTCRSEFELELSTKSFLKRHLKHIDTPRPLRDQITNQLAGTVSPGSRPTNWFESLIRPRSPRPALALGSSLAVILILVTLAPPGARHSHAQPNDANIIHQTFNNFDGILNGRLTPEVASDDFGVVGSYLARHVNFPVNLPRNKRYTLVGGVCTRYNNEPVANVVYRQNRKFIYVYEVNFRCVEHGSNLNLPPRALDQLRATGWYFENPLPECSLAIWVVDSTVCCAVGDIPQEKMLAFLKEAQ